MYVRIEENTKKLLRTIDLIEHWCTSNYVFTSHAQNINIQMPTGDKWQNALFIFFHLENI